MKYKSIYIPSRLQIDTLISIFLLKKFDNDFKDSNIKIVSLIKNKEEDVFYLDIGGGEFDHHNKDQKTTSSDLVSKNLLLNKNRSIQKFLELARRDDFYGKGTLSDDSLDRAFGLPGLLASLNRTHDGDPNQIYQILEPILESHYQEEKKRNEILPEIFGQLKKEGKVQESFVKQRGNKLKIIILESDDSSMTGYLRSIEGGRYDIVALWNSKGYLNIMTRPTKKPILKKLAETIRKSELLIEGKEIDTIKDLNILGKHEKVPSWYYDGATNSLLNGGTNPKNIEPTKIKKESLMKILELGLAF